MGTDELGAKVGSDELGAEMGTDELGVLAETGSDELGALAGAGPDATTAGGDSAKPESDINKISPAIVVAILLGIMAVMITFVFVVRSAIKRRKKRLFAHHRLSMPMFEMREPDAGNWPNYSLLQPQFLSHWFPQLLSHSAIKAGGEAWRRG